MQGGKRAAIWKIGMGLGFILIAIGIFFMTWNKGSIGAYEAYAIAMSGQPYHEILRLSADISQPPLYFLMLHFFRCFCNDSLLALRLLSLIGFMAMVGLGFGPVRRIFGLRTGIIYSWIWILFALIYPGGETMPWAAFFITGAVLYTYIFYGEGRKIYGLYGGLLMLAGCYTHGLTVIVLGILWIWLWSRRRQGEEFRRRSSLVLFGLVFAAFIPLIAAWPVPKVKLPKVSIGLPIVESMIYPVKFSLHSILLYGLCSLMIAGIIYWGHRRVCRSGDSAQWAFRFFLRVGLAVCVVSTILQIIIADAVLGDHAYLPLMGLFFLLLSYGLNHLGGFRIKILACLFLTLALTPVLIELKEEREHRLFSNAISYLKPRLQFGDAFIHLDSETLFIFAHYFPGHQHFLYTFYEDRDSMNPDVLEMKSQIVTDRYKLLMRRRVWLVRQNKNENLYLYGRVSMTLGGSPWNAKYFKSKQKNAMLTLELIKPLLSPCVDLDASKGR